MAFGGSPGEKDLGGLVCSGGWGWRGLSKLETPGQDCPLSPCTCPLRVLGSCQCGQQRGGKGPRRGPGE